MDGLLKNLRIKNQLLRECLAEFLGVYVLIVSKDVRRTLKSPLNLQTLLMIQPSNKSFANFGTVCESRGRKTGDFVPEGGQKEGELKEEA